MEKLGRLIPWLSPRERNRAGLSFPYFSLILSEKQGRENLHSVVSAALGCMLVWVVFYQNVVNWCSCFLSESKGEQWKLCSDWQDWEGGDENLRRSSHQCSKLSCLAHQNALEISEFIYIFLAASALIQSIFDPDLMQIDSPFIRFDNVHFCFWRSMRLTNCDLLETISFHSVGWEKLNSLGGQATWSSFEAWVAKRLLYSKRQDIHTYPLVLCSLWKCKMNIRQPWKFSLE